MNWTLLVNRMMITLLCLQMFNIGVRGFGSSEVCFKHKHTTSMAKMLLDKVTKSEASDDNSNNSNDPADERGIEDCDFADIILYHEHTEIQLPSLFHTERKNDNYHFADDMKSHVLAVVSPPPEC